jgi:hypothetical protein
VIARRSRAALFGGSIAAAFLSACAPADHDVNVTGLTQHPMKAPEIVATIADHTAVLPDGSFEYYAADGRLFGSSGGQSYVGSWNLKGDLFCTLLDNDVRVCSEVGRDNKGVFWSPDGDRKITRFAELLPGNPKNLK